MDSRRPRFPLRVTRRDARRTDLRALALPTPVTPPGRVDPVAFAPAALELALLGELLWCAHGAECAQTPRVPASSTAIDARAIDVYVALAGGTYRYDPLRQRLLPVHAGDLREAAQGAARGPDAAPVQLVFVADLRRLDEACAASGALDALDALARHGYCHVDAGLVAARVALFADAHGLATRLHPCDGARLAQTLGLRAQQRVLLAQSVGFAAEVTI